MTQAQIGAGPRGFVATRAYRRFLPLAGAGGGAQSFDGALHADGTSRWLTASRGRRCDDRSWKRGGFGELEYMTIR